MLRQVNLRSTKTDVKNARKYAELEMQKNGRELDVEVPDFDKNYIFAQRLAKMGSTKRKDMFCNQQQRC